MSLTIGEHDSMWKDVMGRRVPMISENLAIMTNQLGYYNQYHAVKELFNLGLMSQGDYAKNMIEYAKAVSAINKEELNEIEEKYNTYFAVKTE